MKRYLFAKLFSRLSAPELMETCADIGFDGPTLLLRDGFWTEPSNLSTVRPFIASADEHGLEVKYADTSVTPFDEDAERIFATLAENGIENIRLGYLQRTGDVRTLADRLVVFAEKAEKLAEKYGVKALIQIHGGFYPQSATGVWPAIKNLNPRYLGVKMDPGNNVCEEGFEYYDYQVDLLGEYIGALGAKSATMQRNGDPNVDNGWLKDFIPAYDGAIDYRQIYSLLAKAGFDGPSVMMPFYLVEDWKDFLATVKKELDYFDDCIALAKK